MLNQETKLHLIDTAHRLADAARVETLKHFRNLEVAEDNKDVSGGFDPVTVADRASERAMREILENCRPDDGILGEEFGKKEGNSGLRWVLDPIDGTRAFICGTASWGVLISVEVASGPVLGIIDQPYTRERFIGGLDQCSLLTDKGERFLKTRTGVGLENSVLMTTFPEVGTESERNSFEKVRDKVKLTRYGLDCYAYALLALGQIDLIVEAGLHPYDISAPIAVIESAGGIVTDWGGNSVHEGGCVLASGDKDLHKEALALLNS